MTDRINFFHFDNYAKAGRFRFYAAGMGVETTIRPVGSQWIVTAYYPNDVEYASLQQWSDGS